MGNKMFTWKEKPNIKPQIIDHTESQSIIAPIISDIINITISKIPNQNTEDKPNQIAKAISEPVEHSVKKENKKTKKGFFLYSTQKNTKTKHGNSNPHQKSFVNKLNTDILAFEARISQTLVHGSKIKEYIIEKIISDINTVLSHNPRNYFIEVYGSYISGGDIESSDIDILFKLGNKQMHYNVSDLILLISNYFLSLNQYNVVTPIYTANIPLIKLVIQPEIIITEQNQVIGDEYKAFKEIDIYTNYMFDIDELNTINVDISFPRPHKKNIQNEQIIFIKQQMSSHREIKPLVRILKRLLKITGMNNSYKGGGPSYALFGLVGAYIKYANYKKQFLISLTYANTGLDLANFYSTFDFTINVVDVRKDNPYINWKEYGLVDEGTTGSNVPIIIDPVTKLNTGKSSFRINDVNKLFGFVDIIAKDLKGEYEHNLHKLEEEGGKNGEDKEGNGIEEIGKNVFNKYTNS